jgi:hypothetical protein
MINPEAVFVSAAAGSTRTLSAKGLMFNPIFIYFLLIKLFLNFVYIVRNYATVLNLTIFQEKKLEGSISSNKKCQRVIHIGILNYS